MIRAILSAAAVILSVSLSTAEDIRVPLREGSGRKLDRRVSIKELSRPEGNGGALVLREVGSRFVRLQLRLVTDVPGDAYSITISSADGSPIQSISAEELRGQGAVWTDVVNGDSIKVSANVTGECESDLDVVAIAYEHSPAYQYSITYPDDREQIFAYKNSPDVLRIASPVAKLTFVDGIFPATCTGFMIGDSALITNNHCINSKEHCQSLTAIFGYQQSNQAAFMLSESYKCKTVIRTSQSLDVSLIELIGAPGKKWGTLEFDTSGPREKDNLILIHHPAGEPKQITRKDCSVTTIVAWGVDAETDIGHRCDTLKGSSGSPVLGNNLKVVALHHYGFDETSDRYKSENRAVNANQIARWLLQK